MFGPDAVDEHWGEQLKAKLPSDTTLRRSRLLLDASFCVHMADRFKHLVDDDAALFLWMDASPQAKVDWLLSMATIIDDSASALSTSISKVSFC